MANGQGATQVVVKVARGRPLTGALLGIVIGLAIAVVLQQQGVWPLDKITVFLLPAATGTVGLILLSVKRSAAVGPMVIALVILVPMAAWGATDIPNTNQAGQLNGGCMVEAQSNLDTTNVTDTTKRAPFLVDPHGSLKWGAVSPAPIKNHQWEIWVEIADTAVPIESGTHPNDGESIGNTGDVANVTEYAEGKGIPIDQMRGVFMVGGFISGEGGACDGFGFVKIVSDPLETIIAKIAAAIALLFLIILLIIAFTGRKRPVEVPANGGDLGDIDGDGTPDAIVGGAAAAGAAGAVPGDTDGDGDVDFDDIKTSDDDEIFTDGFESGDTSAWSTDE